MSVSARRIYTGKIETNEDTRLAGTLGAHDISFAHPILRSSFQRSLCSWRRRISYSSLYLIRSRPAAFYAPYSQKPTTRVVSVIPESRNGILPALGDLRGIAEDLQFQAFSRCDADKTKVVSVLDSPIHTLFRPQPMPRS
jgi:hypothetical protein